MQGLTSLDSLLGFSFSFKKREQERMCHSGAVLANRRRRADKRQGDDRVEETCFKFFHHSDNFNNTPTQYLFLSSSKRSNSLIRSEVSIINATLEGVVGPYTFESVRKQSNQTKMVVFSTHLLVTCYFDGF